MKGIKLFFFYGFICKTCLFSQSKPLYYSSKELYIILKNRYRQNAGFEDVNLSVQKERKKVTLKRDKSVLKEVTDYAVGQLEGNEWKYEEKYHCSDLRSSDLDNCGKKYLYEI